jgi:hypothetical protein
MKLKPLDFNVFNNALNSGVVKKRNQNLAKKLLPHVYGFIADAEYPNNLNKRYLRKNLYRGALKDEVILSVYKEEFASGFLVSWILWPLFKMLILFIINHVIDNYLE